MISILDLFDYHFVLFLICNNCNAATASLYYYYKAINTINKIKQIQQRKMAKKEAIKKQDQKNKTEIITNQRLAESTHSSISHITQTMQFQFKN